MRKLAKPLVLAVLSGMTLLLCSCQVNWFGTTKDVPWYYIAIPILVILVAGYVILMKSTFVCPRCHTEIQPKWYELSVCIHMGSERIVKCPKCGRRGFCPKKKDHR